MFSTMSGGIRRNSLADFVEINRNGKIAMKLDEGDALVDVATCTAGDDVLLTTRLGQAIRLLGADVILTGLRPTIARTLSELSIDLHFIRTNATIQEALAQMELSSRAVSGTAHNR